MSDHLMPLLSPAVCAVILPFLGALLSLFWARMAHLPRAIALGAVPAATTVLAAASISTALSGEMHEVRIARLMPEVYLSLRVDAAGALFGLTVASLWLAVFTFSLAYLGEDRQAGRYHTFSMLCLAGLMGMAYAGNLVTFLAFYELFSILSYALIVHEGTPKAIAAARKYIVYIAVGGSLLVMGAALTFVTADGIAFEPGGIFGADATSTAVAGATLLLIAGFAVKAALVPLHGWVVDAHPAAPAPFSAALSGVMVAAGAFGILRVVYEVTGGEWLAALGIHHGLAAIAGFTALFGAVLAIRQDDLKRRLAYSTISQMAYVTLGVSLLGTGALAGALVHVTNHAFMKGCLFLCAGVLVREAGLERISEMGGVARRFPVTMAAFTVSALSMIGIPPLSGFVSKWTLGRGMLEAGGGGYLVVLLGGAALAAVYLLPVVRIAYLGGPDDREAPGRAPAGAWREAAPSLLVPVVALAVVTTLLGVLAFADTSPLALAEIAAETLVGSR